MNSTRDTIAVVTTGGTLDKVYFDSLSEYQVGESVVRRLLGSVSHSVPFTTNLYS